MTTATKLALGTAAGIFTLLVLAGPGMWLSAQDGGKGVSARTNSLGARTIARATPAELEIIRSGPITIARYNAVTRPQAACLRAAGATPQLATHEDGRIGYGTMYSGKGTAGISQAIDRCQSIGEAVRATYVYDHVSFFSRSSAYPGLGEAVRKLRGS